VRNPLLNFLWPGLLLSMVLACGTAGYMLIEHWQPLDAFFMTLITISTVGYEEVHQLSTAGKLFSASLILGGIGAMLWVFGIVTEILSTGALAEYRRWRSLENRRQALRDHFIICGYGRMGTQVARELEQSRVSVVVIDNNPDAIMRLRREGRVFVEGDAASEEMLRSAGIERARALISAVDSDERAVYIVLAARALNPNLYILSRAGMPDSIRRLELAGAQRVISPYRMAGHQIVQLALRPNLVNIAESLLQGGIGVEEMVVAEGSPMIGRTLKEAGLFKAGASHLLALRRQDGTLHVNPNPDLRLEEQDLLIALGSEQQLHTTATAVAES
jgi:voltage-gated potassium channel